MNDVRCVIFRILGKFETINQCDHIDYFDIYTEFYLNQYTKNEIL